ncbi:MAG: RnfABCDGE type electron transport complex subunit D, partial [Flavobacteriales bacterium]|nr:RnfABCDGE type electron transport complex subunit D [Flavobacteriales bacterium]
TMQQLIVRPLRFLRRDARHFQIVFLSTFMVYGTIALQWDAEWDRYAILLSCTLAVQALFIRWKGLPWSALKSALITGLGLCLLLHAGHWWTLVLGASVAVASKFMIRVRGKHVFNPANLGIVVAILLTGDAWVSPGQWGAGPMLVFLVGAAGLMVLLRVGRIDTSLAFLLTFAALDLCRTVLFLGWGMDVWAHRMMNGSLLLFSFFMITDPRTTPNAPMARIAWSILIALIAFGMSAFAHVHTAPIWALIALCAFTPLLDAFFEGAPFSWLPGEARTSVEPMPNEPGRRTQMTTKTYPI